MAQHASGPTVEALLTRLQAKGEALGVGPLPGRLLGHMLVCDPPCQTTEEVAAAIDAPVESVETLLDGLVAWGSLTRAAAGNGVAACYALASIEELMQERRALLEDLRGTLDAVASAELPPEAAERLSALRDFYAFLEGEWSGLIARWHARLAVPQAR